MMSIPLQVLSHKIYNYSSIIPDSITVGIYQTQVKPEPSNAMECSRYRRGLGGR